MVAQAVRLLELKGLLTALCPQIGLSCFSSIASGAGIRHLLVWRALALATQLCLEQYEVSELLDRLRLKHGSVPAQHSLHHAALRQQPEAEVPASALWLPCAPAMNLPPLKR